VISPKGEADTPTEKCTSRYGEETTSSSLRANPTNKTGMESKGKSVLETIPEEEQPVASFKPPRCPRMFE
jgi:hypothetical protein